MPLMSYKNFSDSYRKTMQYPAQEKSGKRRTYILGAAAVLSSLLMASEVAKIFKTPEPFPRSE